MQNTEEKDDSSLESVRGSLKQVNNELSSLREALYKSDNSLVVKVSAIEGKLEEVIVGVNGLGNKYDVFKSEDRKGQWGLFILLLTTLLGWIPQIFSWFTN